MIPHTAFRDIVFCHSSEIKLLKDNQTSYRNHSISYSLVPNLTYLRVGHFNTQQNNTADTL